ncbi:MAG: hypothetical protein ACRYHQ_22220 [Janthinobacterium lividum]
MGETLADIARHEQARGNRLKLAYLALVEVAKAMFYRMVARPRAIVSAGV